MEGRKKEADNDLQEEQTSRRDGAYTEESRQEVKNYMAKGKESVPMGYEHG